MKNFYISLVALLSVTAIHAETLTPAEALARLNDTPNLPAKVRVANATTPSLVQTIETRSGEPAVYLFADNDQMMAVSANDVATALPPVKGNCRHR